jgi:predicted enzyme related to lactoylglutathione lyase
MTTATPLNFTKLIVGDLERSAAYYQAVFGLAELFRFEGKIAGDRFEQVVLGVDGAMSGLILVRFVERDAPPDGAIILGFMSPDLAALFERAVAAGGTVHAEIRDPKLPGVALVGFLADPDGHLAEVLQPAAADA